MPKPVYQFFLSAILLTFVAAACNNKKSDKAKEDTKDSMTTKPVDPGNLNEPVSPGTQVDSIAKKPVDPGN